MQNFASFISSLSDKELYSKCQFYGKTALIWRQKFIGLLPEVNRRRLYEKKGFPDIFVFAFKLCGLSSEQVRLTLNLRERVEDKPALREMLENGEVSINKLARVISIATPENEQELAEKVRVLPKSALETFVRDAKLAIAENENENGSQKPLFGGKCLPGQMLNFEIADDIKEQFNELNSKGIDVNGFLREMLKQRQEKIAERKDKIAMEQESDRLDISQVQRPVSHYISTKIKKILKEEYGEKCSINTCQKPAEIIHHTQRWSISRNHDPRFLAPLCKDHHIIAHSVDLKYRSMRKA